MTSSASQGGLDLEALEGLMNRDVFHPLSELETRALIDRVRELEAELVKERRGYVAVERNEAQRIAREALARAEAAEARLASLLHVREAAVPGIKRVIALHRKGWVSGLPGGMPGCEHCSHGPDIGDEGGSGGVVWPCPTLRAFVGIPEMGQSESAAKFEAWVAALADGPANSAATSSRLADGSPALADSEEGRAGKFEALRRHVEGCPQCQQLAIFKYCPDGQRIAEEAKASSREG